MLLLRCSSIISNSDMPSTRELYTGAQLICREEDKVVRILGDDPEASEDAAMSPGKRWTVPSQSMAGRSPSNARSRSLNKVSFCCPMVES